MRRLVLATLSIALIALPAYAQNANQIAAVKAGKSCPGCNLFQANLDYEDLSRRNFSGARLRQSDMTISTADYTNFSKTNLSIANLSGVRATGANFSGADLSNASLVGSYLGHANLSHANLQGADFSGAELSTAIGLTQSQLNTACGDETTELPKGLRIPKCK